MSKRTLSLTVFITGAAILALEILASRYMLPAFGTSIFIWGAVLSVTLLSLAVGYRWGGTLADGLPSPYGRLIRHILLAAGWIAALPLWGASLVRFGLWSGVLLGPVVVAIGLFAVPLTLLATSVPLGFGSVLKMGEAAPGRTLGDLFAISTAGSIVGALLTAYLAVPFLGLTRSLFVVAALLFALVFPAVYKGTAINTAVLILAVVTGGKLVPPEARGAARLMDGVRLLHRTDTRYAQVDVIEDERDGSRIMLLDGASQNWVAGRKWSESQFEYIPALLHYLRRYRAEPGDALVLGLGAGTLVRKLHQTGYRVEVVELDPTVYELARTYFDFPPGIAEFQFGDARAFLEGAVSEERRYDVIIVDVTGGGHHPEHIYNMNAYRAAKRLLKPTGVMAANLVLFTHPPWNKAARHSVATAMAVFPVVEAIDILPEAGLQGDLSQLLLFGALRPPQSRLTLLGDDRLFPQEPALPPLTDDWNPLPLWSVRANAKWHSNIREWLGDAAFLR